MWLGNPPGVGSGYGEQAALFIPRFAAMGHEVAVQCNWGVQGMRIEAGPVTYYPSDNAWGNRALGTYAEHFGADRVVALCDAWVLRPDEWPDDIRVGVWAPVDHYPLPPAVLATLAHPKVQPIAMSRFGERQMRECGLEPLYVPHGVDTTLFNPRPDTKDAIRAELGIPKDAFLVGMVAANTGNASVPRKAFPQAFLAFSRFAASRTDAWLYAHTQAEPPPGGGISLEKLTLATGCPTGRVRFPPASIWHLGATNTLVSNLYQAFDVLLNPSMGEGFGIPILEAQACGVPVIASDHSAMSELTQAGWLVAGDPWWDALQDSFYIVPSIDSIVAALDAAYEQRSNQELRAGAAAFAEVYDADLVARHYWPPALEALGAPREVAPLAQQRLDKAVARIGA
jgi:glycosyltransferase involved in cell wall biosynthesis